MRSDSSFCGLKCRILYNTPRAHRKHTKFIDFPWVSSTSRNFRRVQTISTNTNVNGTGITSTFRIHHLKNSMNFQLRHKRVSEISSNATAYVRYISYFERHRGKTICFVETVNAMEGFKHFFFEDPKFLLMKNEH